MCVVMITFLECASENRCSCLQRAWIAPPNAERQLRRWRASEPARLAAHHRISKLRPAHGPRQRRQLHAMLGRSEVYS